MGRRRVEVLCPNAGHTIWGGDHIPDDWKNMVCDECQDPWFPGSEEFEDWVQNKIFDTEYPDPPPKEAMAPTKPCGVWTEHFCEPGSWDNQRWPDYRNSPPVSTSISELAPGSLLISSGPSATAFVLRRICSSLEEAQGCLEAMHDDWESWISNASRKELS